MYCCPMRTPSPSLGEGWGGVGFVNVAEGGDNAARQRKVREKGYFPEEDILKNIKRIDRERRDYYRYYTGKSWENLENYDLMINTTKLSYDDMVECVVDYLKMRGILAK